MNTTTRTAFQSGKSAGQEVPKKITKAVKGGGGKLIYASAFAGGFVVGMATAFVPKKKSAPAAEVVEVEVVNNSVAAVPA